MIERRLENLLALDYPAEKLELVVASDASTDRTHELVERFAPRVRLIVNERGGKVAAQNRAVRETDERARRLLGRERDLGARRSAPARPQLRRSGGRLRLRPARARDRRRLEPRGRLLALRARAARGRVAARLDHRRQRLDLRGSPLGLRRGRSEVGPRPLVSLPDGAGRPARDLRAGRARLREADADERDRVPAQGADVRALLGDRAARLDAAAAPARAISLQVLSHRVLRYGSGVLHLVLLAASVALVGEGWLYQRALGGQLLLLGGRRARRRARALLRPRHLGDLVALWNYLRRGVPATWTRRATKGTRADWRISNEEPGG